MSSALFFAALASAFSAISCCNSNSLRASLRFSNSDFSTKVKLPFDCNSDIRALVESNSELMLSTCAFASSYPEKEISIASLASSALTCKASNNLMTPVIAAPIAKPIAIFAKTPTVVFKTVESPVIALLATETDDDVLLTDFIALAFEAANSSALSLALSVEFT